MNAINRHALELHLTDMILDIANCYNDVTTSDLQGMAQAATKTIIQDVQTWGD